MKLLRRPLPNEVNQISGKIVDSAFEVHTTLGPGLIESVYESCLAHELAQRNLRYERQKTVPIQYKGVVLNGDLRIDLLVEAAIVVELKAVEGLLPVHEAQLLTYLKLTGCRLGLLINFNVPVIKSGIKRMVL
jgi:GxxExxY protein